MEARIFVAYISPGSNGRSWSFRLRSSVSIPVAFLALLLFVANPLAGQGGEPAVGTPGSLPSGITALAPSPPSGPQPDLEAVARGDDVYTRLNCTACHGAGGRGGPGGAPDLTKSALAMAPDNGRGLAGFLQVGRPEKGMPPVSVPLTEQQAADLSAKLRSLGFAAAAQPSRGGGASRGALPAALAGQQLSILVGNPVDGKKYFNGAIGQCARCHAVVEGQASSASNLAHIARKYPDPKTLQNNMVLNRGLGWSPRRNKDVTAVVTFAGGRIIRGYLTSVSDFKVVVRNEDGVESVIPRSGGEPKVALQDRLQHHLDLLDKYQDDDIHNLTAYLATLK